MSRIKIHVLIGIFLLLGPPGVGAQQDTSSVTLEDLYQMLQKQQTLIESQQATIDALSARLDDVATQRGVGPVPKAKELGRSAYGRQEDVHERSAGRRDHSRRIPRLGPLPGHQHGG